MPSSRRQVKPAWISSVGLTALFLVLGTASAHPSKVRTNHVPTTITHDGEVALSNGEFLITGQVGSQRQICRFFRVVTVKAHYPDGRTRILDSDINSRRGAWAVKADINGADRLKAKATRQVFHVQTATQVITSGRPPGATHHRPHHGKAHHNRKIVCDAASVVWGLD
jgi:hypothetical protein